MARNNGNMYAEGEARFLPIWKIKMGKQKRRRLRGKNLIIYV